MTAVTDALRNLISAIEHVNSMNVMHGVRLGPDTIAEAKAVLAEAEKGESELVAALEYIAARQDGVSRGTAWDQLVDVREAARDALAKHATPHQD